MTYQSRLGSYIAACCLGGVLIVTAGTASAATEATASNTTAPDGALSQRLKAEVDDLSHSRWAILPYQPTYILPVTYMSNPNEAPWELATGQPVDLDNVEVKFQISFMFPVWRRMFDSNASLYAAYTQLSLWQMYNSNSAPFRDTNYEPEVAVLYDTDYQLLGFTGRLLGISFVHQSNGRGNEVISRSWNRIVGRAAFERGNLAVIIKPWYRIKENAKDDNNPDIEAYLGYADYRVAYKAGSQLFAGTLRNNLRGDNKGSIQVDWTFPLPGQRQLRGYLQYFNGYGESMIDYDKSHDRIGVGILLSDWL